MAPTTLPGPLEAHEALSRNAEGSQEPRRCEFCGTVVEAQGRRLKRFCRDLCRTRFHYARRQERIRELQTALQQAEAALKAAAMTEDVAKTVHLARQIGQPRLLPQDEAAKWYGRYHSTYGQATPAEPQSLRIVGSVEDGGSEAADAAWREAA